MWISYLFSLPVLIPSLKKYEKLHVTMENSDIDKTLSFKFYTGHF